MSNAESREGTSSSEPHVIENNSNSPSKTAKDRMTDMLDQVEAYVEALRKEATRLEEERDGLLTTLDNIRNNELMVEMEEGEKEDIHHYADKIARRCMTIEIAVRTTRDSSQEEALYQVNRYIDGLVMGLRQDIPGTRSRCVSFMNSCSSQSTNGITDKNFETAILGCTLDDQKKIKKRLQGLLDYIDRACD